MSYGEGGALASAAASTPAPVLPPGVTPDADAARQALAAHMKANPVTPLFAPTQRPMEPVTAGAPLDPGTLPPTPQLRFSAQAVVLYRSFLEPSGARYEALASCELPPL